MPRLQKMKLIAIIIQTRNSKIKKPIYSLILQKIETLSIDT